MADSLFQVTGVSSGIDWGSIIDKTIEAAKKPATQWQTKIDTLELTKTLYQDLSSELYKLRNTLTPLKLESTYLAKMAEFSVQTPPGADAAGIVRATVKPTAEIAAWDLEIQQVARAQRHISGRQDSLSASLNFAGTFRIMEDERWTTIEVEADDTLRTLNQKLQNAKDQHGNSMPISAQIIDNRIVIDSLNAGLSQEDNKEIEQIAMGASNLMYLPRAGLNYSKKDAQGDYVQSKYPPQILAVSTGEGSAVTTYVEGTDYKYDAAKGLITWLDGAGAKRPTAGTDVNVRYTSNAEVTSTGSGVDDLPMIPSGAAYYQGTPSATALDPNATRVDIFRTDGKGKFTQGVAGQADNDWDYYIDYANEQIVWNASSTTANASAIPHERGDTYDIRIGAQSDYSTSQNKFYLEADDMSADSVLAKLGFITIDENTGEWSYPEGSNVEAQDAKLTVNGVPVTRQSNTIDDLIADVTLELKGEGKVTMDVTQDAQKAVEGMQAFIDQYNTVMTWVNKYLNEKTEVTRQEDEEDTLSSLLGNSHGNMEFGLLHGDQLLWSIKNQMRGQISNPLTAFSNTLNSRAFLHPAEALSMQGSFSINVGGMSARIDVSRDDSLENIRDKLKGALNAVGTDKGELPDTQNSLGLNVEIVNGRLEIKTNTMTAGTTERSPDTLRRSATEAHDYLTFVPDATVPVNGVLTVAQGSAIVYEEGRDFRVEQEETADGVIQSKIVWIPGGRAPKAGDSYNVSYSYNASAVSYRLIEDQSTNSGGAYTRSLSELGMHQDSSKILLSQYGITTESVDYGKSGLLEFDSDKFFEAIKADSKTVASVMTTFMRSVVDTYIGNLVDSSNVIVGGTAVVKGRVASKVASIDTEIGSLNDQITKLEKSLQEKQTSLYSKYSAMEQAIQKMNAQMSSMTKYFDTKKTA